MGNNALVPLQTLQQFQSLDSDIPRLIGFGRVDGIEITTDFVPLGLGPSGVREMHLSVADGNKLRVDNITLFMLADKKIHFIATFILDGHCFGVLAQFFEVSRYITSPCPGEIWGAFLSSEAAIEFLQAELYNRPLAHKRLNP